MSKTVNPVTVDKNTNWFPFYEGNPNLTFTFHCETVFWQGINWYNTPQNPQSGSSFQPFWTSLNITGRSFFVRDWTGSHRSVITAEIRRFFCVSRECSSLWILIDLKAMKYHTIQDYSIKHGCWVLFDPTLVFVHDLVLSLESFQKRNDWKNS